MEILFYNSTSTAFSPYGDYWRRVKKISTIELLNTKRVQSFRSIREEEVSNLVNWISTKEGSPINFTSKVYSVNSCITLRAAFGTKSEGHRDVIQSVMQETLELLSGFDLVDLFPSIGMLQWITGIRSRLEKLHQEIDRMLENIINEHKQAAVKVSEENNKDLVDVLLKVQEDVDDGFHLTTDNIKAVIWDIFLAGTDTTSTTINWAMAELMKNPRSMKKTQAEVRQVFNRIGTVDESSISEMKFLKAVVKETLRLHPPGALLAPRECRERCVMNGLEIPIKTKVIVNAWAIGRDPEYWKEAERFSPERFFESPLIDYRGTSFEYIPFGADRRMCPGISFGMANTELALAMLLYHFDWKLPDGIQHDDLDMTEIFGISIRRKDELNIIPIVYHPSLAA
ncbi:hypothetical protein LWI28_013913 [Acer negundo]|uniref:Cytochrome P450 n=1 Tax=Acer negundo TaxID=4023 RepID=A0AAD5J5S6_ACENE|nr:hypothetical protein LWI28_013913 [Acer negundo]